MKLLDRVRGTIRRYQLADSGTRVVAAVSGGPDSVAMLHLLHELARGGELRVAGIAHFNHQLRSAADDDEQFCARLAAPLGYGFVAGREDVAARARRDRRSIEDAARTARYAFFEQARRELNAHVVAVGHTRDDQAETYLLRLMRGAGPRGLAGMHPRAAIVIRPLIETRRSELKTFLDEQQIPYVQDASNADISIPRNRVRAELLPFIEQRFNPSIVDVLADQAEIARADWRYLEEQAEKLGLESCRREGDRWRLDAEALSRAPQALARLVVKSAMTQAGGGCSIPFRHVMAVLGLAREASGAVDVPGQRAERLGDSIVLTSVGPELARHAKRKTAVPPQDCGPVCYQLPIPGAVELPGSGVTISVEDAPASAAAQCAILSTASTAVVRRDCCQAPLSVRTRRPGDRFKPLGLSGRKKLQDFFVDRKVDRRKRDDVPLVVDGSGRIVWVAGLTIGDEFRVTDPSQAVLILRLKVPGGSA